MREQLLDVDRATRWLAANQDNLYLAREAPYNWLLYFFQELSFPSNDLRWRKGKLCCLAYLSWEATEGNFLLRRIFPPVAGLLTISQLRLPPPLLNRILANTAPFTPSRNEAIQSALRELKYLSEPPRAVAPLLVPVKATGELRGILLLFHRRGSPLPPHTVLTRLAGQLGAFDRDYTRNRPAALRRDAKQIARS